MIPVTDGPVRGGSEWGSSRHFLSHMLAPSPPPPRQALAASLDLAVRVDDAYFNKLVRIMTTRCMTQAVYFGAGDLGEGRERGLEGEGALGAGGGQET